jgi:RNA recognition motif-containing protein
MKLFVGNLSFATVEDDLRDLFSQYGTVTDVFVATDRVSGRSRGFGFVTMGNQAEGQAAISALEGHSLDNRNLTVNEARPKEEGGGRPRSFGGNKRPFSDRRR